MSETKFTPGPWMVGGYLVGAGNIIIRQQWDCDGVRSFDVAEANAHLIAAAPDMYEALEAAILEYGKPGGAWIDKAKAALVKARGEL